MSRFPDFSTLAFDAAGAASALPAAPLWETPEGIAVKPAYGPADTTAGTDCAKAGAAASSF